MKLKEIFKEINERLGGKYKFFCEKRDGRLVAYNIETGKYAGCLPSDRVSAKRFNELAAPGELTTNQVINWSDEVDY